MAGRYILKALDHALQSLQALGVACRSLRTRLGTDQFDGYLLLDGARFLLTAVVDDQVARDAIEERTKIADLLLGLAPAKAQPSLLAQVSRQFCALHLPCEEAQQLARMALELAVGGMRIGWPGHASDSSEEESREYIK